MSWLKRRLAGSRKPETLAPHAADVRARYTDALMASAAVVSVGIGQDEHGGPVIVVGVTAAEKEAVALPRSIEGVPVIVHPVGTIKTQR
ncbi:MAG: hypothetical protein CVT66_11350 [Actinobacteria bacterium HGW-Actinobacteria-6]|jgi:hypothetical protein|nr:MAG: hypothetical protein CVT66_11350 [Actinobacteria bacterium HGW-Actinobacteria-6]